MAVQSSDVIVLVPGLLGFGSFGPKEAPVLSYFRHVQAELTRASRVELGLSQLPRFHVHEPPPTGPLELRVASLAQAVDGALTRSAAGARVHIIGHSTGGLDARLLVNLRYTPPQGPSRTEKERLRAHIASIVSISAPQRGAPFAENFAPLVQPLRDGPLASLLSALYLISILNAARGQGYGGDTAYFAASLAALVKSVLMPVAGSKQLLDVATGLGPEVAEQVRRFLKLIVDDQRLLADLRPDAMRALNAEIAAGDTFPVSAFVTVSPPPVLSLAPARVLYGAAYRWAKPWRRPGEAFPSGCWLGPRPAGLETPTANDGVVTCASQPCPATSGQPPFISEADHLDVVGHFEGAGESFFKSGANLTPQRFSALWSQVARSL